MTYPYTVVLGYDDIVGNWVHTRLDSRWLPGRGNAIGLIDDNEKLVCGWTYSDYNHANIIVDVVAECKGWATPEFLFMCFDYPFNQLGCKRITSPVAKTNTHCQKFVEHLGAELEFVMPDACKTGDVLIYRMFKNNCRWLTQPAALPRIKKHG